MVIGSCGRVSISNVLIQGQRNGYPGPGNPGGGGPPNPGGGGPPNPGGGGPPNPGGGGNGIPGGKPGGLKPGGGGIPGGANGRGCITGPINDMRQPSPGQNMTACLAGAPSPFHGQQVHRGQDLLEAVTRR